MNNSELISLIVNYSKGEITKRFIDENYGQLLMDLLEHYLNDKNSSSLRQIITCEVVGIKSNMNKLGYDGDGTIDEVKPKNIQSDGKKKLDAGGNYSDLTFKRHYKYIDDNPTIHISGFVDGLLIYILKVSYTDLSDYFYGKLIKKFPKGDVTNSYLRSASFTFKNIKSCSSLKIEFVRDDIQKYHKHVQKELFSFLCKKEKS